MNGKIKVQVYGIGEERLSSGCGCHGKKKDCSSTCKNKKSSCHGCGSNSEVKHSCCKGRKSKTISEAYKELEQFINESDVKNSTQLEFIELNKDNLIEEKIKEIIKDGFEPPITVVDGIIRYYGGISNIFIYKDIKELLED